METGPAPPRQALHAARLSLTHPVTRQPLTLEAPLPDELKRFWERLRKIPYRAPEEP